MISYIFTGAKCEANTFDGERCLYGALNNEIRNLLRSFKTITSQTIRRDQYAECLRRYCIVLMFKMYYSLPCRVGLVVSVSASHTVGRGFASPPGHTEEYHNKKMQHSCGVPYSIALSYQFQNNNYFCKPIAITLNIILCEFIISRVYGHTIKL